MYFPIIILVFVCVLIVKLCSFLLTLIFYWKRKRDLIVITYILFAFKLGLDTVHLYYTLLFVNYRVCKYKNMTIASMNTITTGHTNMNEK